MCVFMSTHLLGYSVPVQVALALVHALLVQELALVGNEQGVTYKFSHCSKTNIRIYNSYTTAASAQPSD